ncbi:MAG: type II toxin-antitoxin system Phd/YefM family antitoxin [Pyrinomonadaceae bacterium]
MKTTNIGELKNHLSAYLAEVKRGGEVLVSDRNVPFAKIVPLKNTDDYEAEEMELVAKGLMTLPQDTSPLPDDFFDDLPFVTGNRAIKVLLEERDED